ncbi:hypothetical protein [Alkalihalobacillus trypoxylicola]|uniref:Uncharacterized protein n=1 Tax=Alkalihalobacillus trypoxylicola TaxID=519424 RepID=A0A162F6I7_9BACI|nr:hypothetical protein [Alkalihalobacillus trypoxylicola]KYG34899.1 hypothetical protein AZF04_00775 [Alkalihalobacillus trypoxylicola]
MNIGDLGEREFIEICTEAIMNCYTQYIYLLYELPNGVRFFQVECELNHANCNLKLKDGTPIRLICVMGRDLIEDFHQKALNDELGIEWVNKGVKHVIATGELGANKIV